MWYRICAQNGWTAKQETSVRFWRIKKTSHAWGPRVTVKFKWASSSRSPCYPYILHPNITVLYMYSISACPPTSLSSSSWRPCFHLLIGSFRLPPLNWYRAKSIKYFCFCFHVHTMRNLHRSLILNQTPVSTSLFFVYSSKLASTSPLIPTVFPTK